MFLSIFVTHLSPTVIKTHLNPKHNITWIKTPKTQNFSRKRPVVRSTCSSWFGVSRGGENTSFATSKLGKVVSVKKIKVFVSVLDLGFQILFKCELTVWKSKFVLRRNRVLLICLHQVVISRVHVGICAMSRLVFWEQVWVCTILGGGS